MEDGSSSLTVMPLDLLREITNDFSEERELGRGSFGKVYLGVHPDGEMIAVKKLYDMPGLDDKQFLNEFKNLTRLKHQNIVRLVGYCHDIQVEQVKHEGKLVLAEKTHRALCLEYMSKGSLDKYLSDECDRYDWRTCYRIIRGICQGLKYLHNELVYHFDLKPANVLLDENMDPRIADFGTSRLFSDGQTRCTQSLLGTLGYLPPEFIRSNFISNKFDIFSLGVVIIKMMAGRPGYSKSAEMPSEEFTNLIQENWTNRLLETPNRRNAYSEQIKMCIEIGLSCVQEDRHERPTIQDIVYRLEETETKCTDAARKDWLSIFQANRNTPPQYAQDPNDRPAEQIHHGPTFHTFIIPATHSNCLEESPDADVPNSTLKVNNWKIAAYKKFEERENSGGLVPDYLMRNGQPVRAVLLNDEAGPSEQARTAWEYPNDMAAQHGASLTGQQNEYLSSLTTDALGTSSPVTAVERGQHHPPAPQNETPYYLSQRNVLNSQGPISGQPTIPSHILLPVPEDDLLTGASLTGYQNGHLSTLMDAPGTSCPVTGVLAALRFSSLYSICVTARNSIT